MLAAALMTLVCVAGGAVLALQGGHGGFPLAVTAVVFAALLFPYMGFLFGDLAERVRQKPRIFPLLAPAAIALQLVYAFGTGSFDLYASLRLAAFLVIPTIIVHVAARRAAVPSWLDLLAVACIWLPFDTGHLKGIWAWPAGEGAYVLNTALAVSLAATAFVGFRGLPDVKIRLRWSRADVLRALVSLAAFMLIAIPFGLATDFIKINPRFDALKLLGTPVAIFFFIAFPEELLFRGLVQNILQKKLGARAGWILASIFFGATHYNNTPTPDWRYLLLATIAGLFYGFNYTRSKSLLGPALMHALVDAVWMLFFMNDAIKG